MAEVNLTKPLFRGAYIWLGEHSVWAKFCYEQLGEFCYYCGRVEHLEKNYTSKRLDASSEGLKNDQYDDWMLVFVVRKLHFQASENKADSARVITRKPMINPRVEVSKVKGCLLGDQIKILLQYKTLNPSISRSAAQVQAMVLPHNSNVVLSSEPMIVEDIVTIGTQDMVVATKAYNKECQESYLAITLELQDMHTTQDMELSQLLVNVRVLEKGNQTLPGVFGCKGLQTQNQLGPGKGRKKWTRATGKENQDVQKVLAAAGGIKLGTKRAWQL